MWLNNIVSVFKNSNSDNRGRSYVTRVGKPITEITCAVAVISFTLVNLIEAAKSLGKDTGGERWNNKRPERKRR